MNKEIDSLRRKKNDRGHRKNKQRKIRKIQMLILGTGQ